MEFKKKSLVKIERRPDWLKKKIEFSGGQETADLLRRLRLNTVCREARCPNISECYRNRHATFLILGKVCTRSCAFCGITKGAAPHPPDPTEPGRVAGAARRMGLRHVVITSVTRDDVPDGGAGHFAQTIRLLRRIPSRPAIEVLVPDFRADTEAIAAVTASSPDIFGHNLETVLRLYHLRPGADYRRSLNVLRCAKTKNSRIRTKTALMLGLGETQEEVADALRDLRGVDCDFLALGQYLRPDKKNTEVKEYLPPRAFEEYRRMALSIGFLHVESSPYVRSSYRAGAYLEPRTAAIRTSSAVR